MRGFSRSEQRAILFLLSTFGLGALVWWYRQNQPIPEVSPADVAAFEEFMRALQSDSIRTSAHYSKASPKKESVSPPVDLNSATYNDLVRLSGIGPVMAKRIIAYREANGPFKRLQDLRKIKGIGAKTYEKLALLLIVN